MVDGRQIPNKGQADTIVLTSSFYHYLLVFPTYPNHDDEQCYDHHLQ
jgi:hypothetical protein